jgi:hypothetical protein
MSNDDSRYGKLGCIGKRSKSGGPFAEGSRMVKRQRSPYSLTRPSNLNGRFPVWGRTMGEGLLA